jgi:hypothetical protein
MSESRWTQAGSMKVRQEDVFDGQEIIASHLMDVQVGVQGAGFAGGNTWQEADG